MFRLVIIFLSTFGLVSMSFAINDGVDGMVSWTGVLDMPNKLLFSMADMETGHRKWVAIGGHFSGGQVVEYTKAENALVYRRGGRDYTVKLANSNDKYRDLPSLSLADQALGTDGKALKSFDTVPEGVKKMPPTTFLAFLAQEGYEIPEHVVIAARSELINNSIRTQGAAPKLKNPVEPSKGSGEGIVHAPRNPIVATSFSYEEKVARGIIGY